MEAVGDILQRVCPCGGDPSGPQHEESLLHRKWMLGKGLENDHDPFATPDRRRIADLVPVREHHDLG